jgi:hypothetical protein
VKEFLGLAHSQNINGPYAFSLFREVAESQFQIELDNVQQIKLNNNLPQRVRKSWIMSSPHSQLQMELDNNLPKEVTRNWIMSSFRESVPDGAG